MKTKVKEPTAKLLDPIAEARRYYQNAKEVLEEKGKLNSKTGYYADPKYVRSAGNYLWSGVLIALDSVFDMKTVKKNKKGEQTRLTIRDYLIVISNRDLKLLNWVQSGYSILHLAMTYDGIQDKDICQKGFQLADQIINRCEKMKTKPSNHEKRTH